jgi:hypothetical protein
MARPLPDPDPILILLGVWAVSAYLLHRGAKTAAQVLGRGFLLGAAEWIAFAVAIVAAGLLVRAAIAVFMAVGCLAGFATVQAWRRVKSPALTDPR